MTHYDLLIVGAGSANSILDERFAHLRVAFVEPGPWGGTCLNRGCIPSKMFIHPADVALDAVEGPRLGVHTSYAGVDWAAIRDRIFSRIDPMAASGEDYRAGQDDVDVLRGTAAFTGERELRVDLHDGGSVTVTADQVVLGAGSRPVVPDLPGLADVVHHTSDTVMRLETFPERIAILGGGYVGCEFAHVFASYGAQVTQVQRGPRLLASHDEDISTVFTAEASRRWDVRLGVSAERVTRTGSGAALLHLSDGSTVEVDVVLLATGRAPNSDLLDVAAGGVETDDKGLVVVDEHQRTSAPGVWALGDLSSPEPLKHVANQDARVVQHNLLAVLEGRDDLVVSDHRFVPAAVFSHPQVASVGLTEAQARDQGIDVVVATKAYDTTAHGWALMEDDSGHVVKLLADRATGQLVGAHLIGPEASILVQTLVQAMSFGLPVAGLARGQYWPHPALTEVVEGALLDLEAALG